MSGFAVKDRVQINDVLRGGPRRTRIIMRDHNTGEILYEGSNKVLAPGSQISICKQFGLQQTVIFPTYNTELELDHSLEPFPAIQPYNDPITCLWCAGRSGAGSSANEVNVVANNHRISPDLVDGTLNQYVDIVPFRYVDSTDDLDADERETYFGRKTFLDPTTGEPNGKIAYFFKKFETEPMLNVRYLDGTEVTKNVYKLDSSQQVEVYVEMKLAISRQDFRDYFDDVLGWGSADISAISLLTAWYDDTVCENPDADDADKIYYKYYQDVVPFSLFYFGAQSLADLNKAIDFTYQVYY